jgi:aminoglycoside phosphotransferase family enzyme/predicted kinase
MAINRVKRRFREPVLDFLDFLRVLRRLALRGIEYPFDYVTWRTGSLFIILCGFEHILQVKSMSDNADVQTKLLSSLKKSGAFPGTSTEPTVLETHISTVFLTGDFAYKIKKPVDFGFLDFSDLDKRHHFCEEELRLNRRLAPDLYLEVIKICGPAESPVIEGDGEAIEYAIKMRQFEQDNLFNQLQAEDRLSNELIRQVALIAADFHSRAESAGADKPYGTAEAVMDPMQQNFDQLRGLIEDSDKLAQLDTLEKWTQDSFKQLKPLLETRKANGFIRECHGDMHLGNIALVDNQVAIFDGIEFNDFFRWTDVMSEIAFLTMDLDHRGARGLSNIALNSYLEASGDYEGLPLLRFYQVYRAMVRAKVSSFMLAQEGLSDEQRNAILDDYQGYIDLAMHYAKASKPALIVMHGFSGSGKTHISTRLAEETGAIHLRSDIERKRLAGIAPETNAGSDIASGIYSHEMSEKTYQRLKDLSDTLLQAGFNVIVDATFLTRAQRDQFASLTPNWVILDIQASEDELRQNILSRETEGSDASDATTTVMSHQLENHEPLAKDEPVITMKWDNPIPLEALNERLNLIRHTA